MYEFNVTNRLWFSVLNILCFSTIVAPRIAQADTSDVVLVEDGTLLLHCSASGDPSPNITWEVPIYTEK